MTFPNYLLWELVICIHDKILTLPSSPSSLIASLDVDFGLLFSTLSLNSVNHSWAFDHHSLTLAQICNYGRDIFNFPTIWEFNLLNLNLLNLNEYEAICAFDVQQCGVCWESELVSGGKII